MALELWLTLPTPIQPDGSSSPGKWDQENRPPTPPSFHSRTMLPPWERQFTIISHLFKLHVAKAKLKLYVVEKSGISPSPQLLFIGQRLLCQVWQAKNVCVCVCVCVCVFSHVWLFETTWAVAHQAPLSMESFQARVLKQIAVSYSRGSSCPRDESLTLASPALADGFFT